MESRPVIFVPFLPCWNVGESLFEEFPVRVKLLGSLIEISAVRGQRGLFRRDHSCSGRASKATNIL